MITLKRFRMFIDSHGGDLRRWPEAERDAAREFLDHSCEARALLAHAQSLDQAITAAAAHEDARLWPAGEQDAALARLRLGVAARIAQKTSAHRQTPADFMPGWLAVLPLRGLGMATGGGFVAAVGLVIGLTYAAAPASGTDTVLAMLQPAPLPVLAGFDGGDGTHD